MGIKLSTTQENEKKAIDIIKDPSQKIYKLREMLSKSDSFKDHKRLSRLQKMIDGLEHRYKIHSDFEEKAKNGEPYDKAYFDAMDYIKIIGQIHELFSSWLLDFLYGFIIEKDKTFKVSKEKKNRIEKHILSEKIPIITVLISLRNKRAVHRQEDCPHWDDSQQPLFDGPVLMGSFKKAPKIINLSHEELCLIMKNKKREFSLRYQLQTKQRKLPKYKPAADKIELYIGKENILEFAPSRDHKKIIDEVFYFLDFILFD